MANTTIPDCIQTFETGYGKPGKLYSLPALEKAGVAQTSRMPVSIRIVLESLLRNLDGKRVREQDVLALCNWKPNAERVDEVPFVVARVLLQDFTGVPLVVDLAAMRSAVSSLKQDPNLIQPLVPVDLVIDHSVQVDYARQPNAMDLNMKLEFQRNRPRYEFLKWGMQAFNDFGIVPPGIGIVHQVNLEYLAKGVLEKKGVYYPDTLVGTDSHTTMINGLGIVGWGVGGIEAEAGMLGQPVYFLMPDVVGMHLSGSLREGVTATDAVLHITEMLRKAKVVGKFVEFHGEGAAKLPLAERATIANMAPEYGATMGFFPIDEETCRYMEQTGRPKELVQTFRAYFKAQGLFGMPKKGDCDYTTVLELNLADVQPGLAGPKRPQDRINLSDMKTKFVDILKKPAPDGYGKEGASSFSGDAVEVAHGDVLIAAITSCTNTSNPGVMLAAGILAKKAVERGLSVNTKVKTSIGPGSRVVKHYLEKTGLLSYLSQLGFDIVGYGCTTCIGNSGPLDPKIQDLIKDKDIVAASVLSGNRNFEARVHQHIKANFLASPPLVVAYAIAGNVMKDLTKEPLGKDKNGADVYLKDIWPTPAELSDVLGAASDPEAYRKLYSDLGNQTELWKAVPSSTGQVYEWDRDSTYIQEPPYFEGFSMTPGSLSEIKGARPLAIFGDSVTTDHISPAGAIKASSPAGLYLQERGVKPEDFNSYGARRGSHDVMVRGTFANVRIKNLMVPGTEGGITIHQPSGEKISIYDAALRYEKENVPLVVFAGHEYGTGSSRDWAAKGTQLLGVRAVVARSFERIHRSNLLGMGVLPCQFPDSVNAQLLKLDGSEVFDLLGVGEDIKPQQLARLVIHRKDGKTEELDVKVRIDTPIEVDYYKHGGILPYVLRQLLS